MRRSGTDRRVLIAEEAEYLILLNRGAESSTELVTTQRVLFGGEEIPRVEVAVAHEFEQVPMELICARLGNYVYDAAGMNAKLSRQAVGLYTELLQSVRERKGQVDVGKRIIIVAAVHDIVIGGWLATGYGNRYGVRVALGGYERVRPTERSGGIGRSAAGEQDQVGGLASV